MMSTVDSFLIGLLIGTLFGVVVMGCVITERDNGVTQEVPCNIERVTMQEVCSANSNSASCRITQIKYVECMGVVDKKGDEDVK